MNQTATVTRACASILKQLKGQLTKEQGTIIYNHLFLVFGAGFDLGYAEKHLNKQVIQFNEEGEVHTFRNVNDAAAYMGVSTTSIYKAINKKGTKNTRRVCQGYFWKYRGT